MFDLDAAVTSWRLAQQQSGVQGDSLDELESHLRDTISSLSNKNLSSEEAFFVAIRRLGSPQDIANEFTKIDRWAVWKNRLPWMLTGYLIANLASLTLGVSTRAGHLLATRYHLSATAAVSVACYAPFAVMVVVALALFVTRRRIGSSRASELGRRILSTPSLVFISCSLIFSAYVLDFLVRRLSFAIIPIQESQRLGQKLAFRDGLIMILCPVLAAIVAICLVRRRQHQSNSHESA